VQVSDKGASSKKVIVGVESAFSQAMCQPDVTDHGWATLRVAP
jgi:hypothetical protein